MDSPTLRAAFLYSLSGTAARPWAEAGYECFCYDIQHSIRADRVERVGKGSITYRWADIRSLTNEEIGPVSFICSMSPCTRLTVAGARDFERKGLRTLIDALELFESGRVLCANSGAPYYLEQPISIVASLWRKPDHYFHPWQYGGYLRSGDEGLISWPQRNEHYTKKTSIWVGNGFEVPPFRNTFELSQVVPDDRIHKAPPTDDRADVRSATPLGWSRAVFAYNSPLVRATVAA